MTRTLLPRLAVLAYLLCAPSALAQDAITQQPASITVAVGQTATFTASVSGGPCSSVWNVNGLAHPGATGSTVTYSISTTSAMVGKATLVWVRFFNCKTPITGGDHLDSTTATLTVTPGASLQSVAVTPANTSVLTQSVTQFAATGTFSDGSTQPLTNCTWASSGTNVTISSAGVAVASLISGSVEIMATCSGITGQTTLTVNSPTITITVAVSETDGSPPPAVQVVISEGTAATNAGPTVWTPILTLTTDATGAASGSFTFDQTQAFYKDDISVNGVQIGESTSPTPLIMVAQPELGSIMATAVLIPGTSQIKKLSWTSE